MAEYENLKTAEEFIQWWQARISIYAFLETEKQQVQYCVERLPLHFKKPLIKFNNWDKLLAAAKVIDEAYKSVEKIRKEKINKNRIVTNSTNRAEADHTNVCGFCRLPQHRPNFT